MINRCLEYVFPSSFASLFSCILVTYNFSSNVQFELFSQNPVTHVHSAEAGFLYGQPQRGLVTRHNPMTRNYATKHSSMS